MTSVLRTGSSLPRPEGSGPPEPDAGADHSIVVGLDGSPTSWDALSWALGEAARRSVRVLAVYVVPTVELASALAAAGAPDGYAAIKQAETDTAEELKAEAEAQGHRLRVPITFVRAEGDSAHELMRIAQSARSDLIVVGRSSKVLHRLAGSIARRLVSNPDAPTVVVVP